MYLSSNFLNSFLATMCCVANLSILALSKSKFKLKVPKRFLMVVLLSLHQLQAHQSILHIVLFLLWDPTLKWQQDTSSLEFSKSLQRSNTSLEERQCPPLVGSSKHLHGQKQLQPRPSQLSPRKILVSFDCKGLQSVDLILQLSLKEVKGGHIVKIYKRKNAPKRAGNFIDIFNPSVISMQRRPRRKGFRMFGQP